MIDRRDFMIGGGMVAGAMLLEPALKIAGAHAAPAQGAQVPGYYRTKVGGFQVTALLDGGLDMADDLFTGVGGKPEDMVAAKERYFLDTSKPFPGVLNGFLINTGTRLILVDTGGGTMMGERAGNLERNLAAAGVTPDQVDEIILTHAHPDHAGGLLDGGGMRVFKKATVRISADDLDFWYNEDARKRLPQKAQMFDLAKKLLDPYKSAGQIKTFRNGESIKNGVTAIALPGHTPGHSGIRVSDGNDQLIIWGDIVHQPALQFDNPEQSIGYDIDADLARVTRKKIFDEVVTDRIRVAGMHLCFPGIGHLAKSGNGYDFVPQIFEQTL